MGEVRCRRFPRVECYRVLVQQLNPIYRDATTTYKNPTFMAAQ